MPAEGEVLTFEGVSKQFAGPSRGDVLHAVSQVNFTVAAGEIVAIVGESGCGKSTMARLAVRLMEPTAGRIAFLGEDIAALSPARFRHRRRDLQIVFQDSASALDPRHRVIRLIDEPLLLHTRLSRAAREERVRDIGRLVHLPEPLLQRFPSQLSGGQLQRVGIARAIATDPKLLVLDEPTSALDLSVRAGILELLAELRRAMRVAMLLISHDLASVRRVADRVLVAYLGRIVESGPAAAVLSAPAHPYTQALLAAELHPEVGSARSGKRAHGEPPNPFAPPSGCAFAPRCPVAMPACRDAVPPSVPVGLRHEAACLRVGASPPVRDNC